MEYGWEAVRTFERELIKLFPKTYKRKYSLQGNGIYNLILVQNKIYEIKVTQTKKTLVDNNMMTSDSMKNLIIKQLFKSPLLKQAQINNGKITFKLQDWILKIEVVKKIKMPE